MTMSKSTAAKLIEDALIEAFQPESIELIDDSWRHKGHSGPRAGEGHYSVKIISDRFEGKSRLERHKMVYGAIEEQMHLIHALAITALTPEEGLEREQAAASESASTGEGAE